MEKRHKVFIAINLPPDIKKVLARHQEKYQEIPAKWISQSNMHITLEFLGDLTDQEIGDTCKIAKEVAERHNSLTINLNNISFGPHKKISLSAGRQAPKMIWASGQKSKELTDLKNDLTESLLESVRFAPESREFTPHVTLARISEWQFKTMEPEEVPEIDENIELIFTAESLEVMESVSKREGPVYEVLESCEFKP